MNRFSLSLLILLWPLLAAAQEKRVYTVAGKVSSIVVIDGSPATSGALGSTEGIWIDGNCNLYISEVGENKVRKVNLGSGIITTIASNGIRGFSGDNGPATAASINGPYGLYADSAGNVYFADGRNVRVRRVDAATGIITTLAGGGLLEEDGVAATNARLTEGPSTVYGDKEGNIYIGIKAKIRKVDKLTGIISTVAGNGTFGLSGDGGLATNAQVYNPSGMLFDPTGNLIFADRGNHRIRIINGNSGIINTISGSTVGDSGDGGLATNAQIGGPISIALDIDGNLIIGDNGSDRMRMVNPTTQIITSVAGVGNFGGSHAEGAFATEAYMHPEFVYLDNQGNLYYSTFGGDVRKITGFRPGYNGHRSDCLGTDIRELGTAEDKEIKLHPNPATDEITITNPNGHYEYLTICNYLGQVVHQGRLDKLTTTISIGHLPTGMYIVKVTNATTTQAIKLERQ